MFMKWPIQCIQYNSKFKGPNTQKQPSEVFYKKVVLQILQNSQENPGLGVSFLTKLQALQFY